MLVNADCTLIELVGTAANPTVKAVHKIKNVYWNDSRGRTLIKNGVQISDSVVVYLYSDEYIPKTGDIIVHGEVNFEFDNSTQKSAGESMKSSHKSAISDLQELLNKKGAALKVDGIAGEKTISECKKYIIDKGDKGELTKWVQERLNSLGYSCGIPDGIAGSKTMTAISKWQSDNKLGCGYLGGSDWNVLLDQI